MLRGIGLSEEELLALESDYYGSREYADFLNGLAVSADGYYEAYNSTIAFTASERELTADQENILLRVGYMLGLRWSPLRDVPCYGSDEEEYMKEISGWVSSPRAADGTITAGCFAAGRTYAGPPYSQPVYNGGYIGWDLSIEAFAAEVGREDGRFYTERSTYAHNGPYYGSDCTAFVSWVWGCPVRRNLSTLLENDCEYIGRDISMLRIGDCLEDPAKHVTLVTDIGYNAAGEVVSVELTEQTPCMMRTYCFGELLPGRSYIYWAPLSFFVSHYFGGDYSIYRRASDTPVLPPESDPAPSDAAALLQQSGKAPDAAAILRKLVGLTP